MENKMIELPEDFRTALIKLLGKPSAHLFIGGHTVADARAVDRVLFPIGTKVLVNGKVDEITAYGSWTLIAKNDLAVHGEDLVKLEPVTILSIKKDGVETSNGFVETDKLNEAFDAMVSGKPMYLGAGKLWS